MIVIFLQLCKFKIHIACVIFFNICWFSLKPFYKSIAVFDDNNLMHMGWDNVLGVATRYGWDCPRIDSCQFQWPSGLRHRLVTSRLLVLRFRIPLRTWKLVLFALSLQRKKQTRTIRTKESHKESQREGQQRESKNKISAKRDVFRAPFQTGPGAHPVSYNIDTGSLSRG